MEVKIDTKEKFTVITPISKEISANMSADLLEILKGFQNKEIPHVILNMKEIDTIDFAVLESIVNIQQSFYNDHHSFVICGINEAITKYLYENDYLDTMNVTPTESEAWDIVQMEEIEREIMNGTDD